MASGGTRGLRRLPDRDWTTRMEPHSQPATWVEIIGWVSLAVAFASALVILIDILGRGYRQKMAIMDWVYPITALYWGPVALWFYFRHGRRNSQPVIEETGPPDPDRMPRWVVLSKAVSHCGAGCTLGDIAGEWLVAGLGLMIAGKSLLADIPMDFVWAWTLGIVSSTSPSCRCARSARSKASGRR